MSSIMGFFYTFIPLNLSDIKCVEIKNCAEDRIIVFSLYSGFFASNSLFLKNIKNFKKRLVDYIA